jgi:SAM-dependent methyltransferase
VTNPEVRTPDRHEHTDAAQRFWDANHSISEDPLFWMANPLCRRAINRRVTGDPNVWPLDGLAAFVNGKKFRRGLSLGCGMGSLERWARKSGLCEHVTGIDLSPVTLDIARERAKEEGVSGITYELGDMNQLRLPADTYDLIFIHQALHHVVGVEKLLGRLAQALTADGLFFIDEWTGPSRDEWKPFMIERAKAIYAGLPSAWRIHGELVPPILAGDPSEAVRSSAIMPGVRLFFDAVEKPYGGHLSAVILSQLNAVAAADPALQGHIERWLALEDDDIANHPERSYYAVVAGRPRRGIRRAIGLMRAAGRRVRLRGKYVARAFVGSLRAARHRLRGR